LRGRDLGPLLAGSPRGEGDPGFAFAETDDYTLLASGRDRLVCQRRIAACALYRPDDDAAEQRDFGHDEPAQVDRLRTTLRAVERDHGRYEAAGGGDWPEPIRRGMQGEVDSAADVAQLLDDADVAIRRKAAEVCFGLRSPATAAELRRALARDEDPEVRRWAALALVRVGEPIAPLVEAMAHGTGASASPEWRRRASLVLAERGDERVCDEIATWWTAILPSAGQAKAEGEPGRLAMDLLHVEELLEATRKARCTSAVPALASALEDVRARPYVADVLGALGDPRARGPLLAALATETQVTTRPHEARALLALGAHAKAWPPGTSAAKAVVAAPRGPARLLALVSDPMASLEGSVDGKPCVAAGEGAVRLVELGADHGSKVRVELQVSAGDVVALWVAPNGPVD
jgi:HEAT repeat protein